MTRGEEKARRWRNTLSDIALAICGLCLSLSLVLAFVRIPDQITGLIYAFTAAFIFGGTIGFIVARFLGHPVKVVLGIAVLCGTCLTFVIVLAIADYGPFP